MPILLIILNLLHAFWFVLICRIIVRAMAVSSVDDIRSDSDCSPAASPMTRSVALNTKNKEAYFCREGGRQVSSHDVSGEDVLHNTHRSDVEREAAKSLDGGFIQDKK